MPHDPAPGPLAGLLVADLSTVLAGPLCTMVLADLGADVVKVEPPEGDSTRGWGPPWVGSAEDGTRTAAYFLSVNRNKRSLRLDLRQAAGQAVLHRLIERSDVLVENFRPGTLERIGLSATDLGRLNERIVHLAISGYGREGPAAARPGYDFVVQAEAGLMSITGFPDADGGQPTKVGVAIADVVTGLFGAVGVLGALLARGPAGQRVDVSILASTLASLVNQAQNAFATGTPPGRHGNAHPNIVPYETFATADGDLAVGAGSERQWRRLCTAMGLEALAADPRFATNGDRVAHRTNLRSILAPRFAERPSADWLAALEAAEVPVGRTNDVIAAFETPQARFLGSRVRVEHPRLGSIDQVAPPIGLSATPATIRRPPPLLGEHADEILAELGYDPAAVAGLRDAGVI